MNLFWRASHGKIVGQKTWPELNQRVNYPIKRILITMANKEEINMVMRLQGSVRHGSQFGQ